MRRLAVIGALVQRLLEAVFSRAGRLLDWLGGRRLPVWLLSQLARLERTPWGLTAALAVGLAALAAMSQLVGLLAGMHVPGAGSYTITDLTGTVFDGPSAERSADVVRTWREHPTPPGFSGPTEVIWAFVLIDSLLFAPAYAALLAIVLLKVARALTTAAETSILAGQYLRLARFAFALVPLLLLADLAENGLIAAVYETDSGVPWLSWLLWAVTTAKWLLAALVVAPVAISGLSLAFFFPLQVRQLGTALVVLRPQLLLVLLFAAGLFVSDQAADAIRRWRDDPADLIAAVALTLWLAAVLRASCSGLVSEFFRTEREPPGPPALFGAGAILFFGGVVGELMWDAGRGVCVLGIVLVVIGALSGPLGDLEPAKRHRTAPWATRWLPRVLAAAPVVLLGVAVLQAAVPEIAYARNDWFWLLLALGLGLQAAGWLAVLRAHALLSRLDTRQSLVLRLSLAGALLLALRVWSNPWRTAEVLGSIGVFAGFMVAGSLVAYGLAFVSEHVRPPAVFTLLRLRRTPVFVLLLIWLVGATKIDSGTYYDARTIAASVQAAELQRAGIKLERPGVHRADVFGEWLHAQPSDRKAVPLVLVAAAGGGIRAAYWTGLVLGCLLEGRGDEEACAAGGAAASARAAGSVFALSGISGGSLGLAAYEMHVRREPRRADWIDERLDDDYIAPVIAWALFADLPSAFVGRSGGTDRAEVLERAWERSWLDDLSDDSTWALLASRGPETDASPFAGGIFDLWARGPRLPLLLLNGTKVQDGCRFNASVFDASVEYRRGENVEPATVRLAEDCLALRLFEAPAEGAEPIYVEPGRRVDWTFASTEDLSDFVCPDRDVRLSTAVLLSARFPFVTPSGRLVKCKTPGAPAINIVDGGYFDTSGASSLVELWSELEPEIERANRGPGPCVVPLFVQIDTGYADPVGLGSARPVETRVPLLTLATGRNAREANARQAAALAFSGPFGGKTSAVLPSGAVVDRFAHIYSRAHPGAKAPLGWTLSQTARTDLKRQLVSNQAEIEKVRSWFSEGLSCE